MNNTYLPWISIGFSIFTALFAIFYKRGRVDQSMTSDIVMIRSAIGDITDKSIVRIHDRMDTLDKGITACLNREDFKEFKRDNERRQEAMNAGIHDLCLAVQELKVIVRGTYVRPD